MNKETAMNWCLRLMLFVIPCYPAEVGMPACNSANRGRLWPEQANTDRAAARQAAKCGELQMCMQGKWRYGWKPIAVNVNQLGQKRGAKIAGCEVQGTPVLQSDAARSGGPASR